MPKMIRPWIWTMIHNSHIPMGPVEAGEYHNLTLELCQQRDVEAACQTHVVNHLMRVYCEWTRWGHEELNHRNMMQRQTTRLKSVLAQPLLTHLTPVVEACCSDDKTDKEEESQATSKLGIPQKKCVVLDLPWRHPCIKRLMMGLDRLRAQRLEDPTSKSNAPPQRIRRRPAHPQVSRMAHKVGLPITFYNEEWLKTLSVYEAQALDSRLNGPQVEHYIGLIDRLL